MKLLPDINDKLEKSLLKNPDIDLPHVTIILTNYNYTKYVIQCLNSIENQDYSNYSCIIVDDCSTDNSVEIINRFISENDDKHKFKLIQHSTNLGQMAGFLTGLKEATGAFVVYIDADDIILPEFLAKHITYHLSFQIPVAFTCSNQLQIDETGQILYSSHPGFSSNDKIRLIEKNHGIDGDWIWATTSSMMFRKAVLEMILPDSTKNFKVCADAYIARFGNLVGRSLLIPAVLGCYRRHQSNNFSSNPFIGGILPPGDMRTHPSQICLNSLALLHLSQKEESFISVLGRSGFLCILLHIMSSPKNIGQYLSFCKQSQNKKPELIKFNIKICFLFYLTFKYLKRKLVYTSTFLFDIFRSVFRKDM